MAGLLKKLLVAVPAPPAAFALHQASVAASRRLFNTGGALFRRDDEGEDRRRVKNLSILKPFSADVVDPFGERLGLGRPLDLMEGDTAAPRRGWWVSKEDDNTVQLKVAMPGFGKEHVKVWLEKNILVIKGEADKEYVDGDDESLARYSRRIELPAEDFKMDQITAEMLNGVLKVNLPKIKTLECKDVLQIKVE